MRTEALRKLNFRHLHYFWLVAKEGHLTRVARQLFVSQSALSSQIRQLEAQLGYPLFERHGRNLSLTEFGNLVLGYAESIFTLGSELMAVVQGGEAARVPQLRVGAVATLSRNFQENFLRPAMDTADLQLVIESASLEELLERLRVHRLDLILSNRPVTHDGREPWRCKRLARQSVCLVGPPRRKSRPFRYPDDLAVAKLLLPGRSSEIRSQFDLLCEDLGLRLQVYAEIDDMAMLRLMARDTGGVAVVPEVVVQDELESGVLQKYCELPRVFETFYSIATERRFQSAVVRQLLAKK